MMGLFWLITGIALLSRSQNDAMIQMVGNARTRIIAIVGVVAGLLVVTRGLTRQLVPEGTFIVLLGVVILLTGLVHLTANASSYGRAVGQKHRWLSILLGAFEMGLGLTLIIYPLDRSPLTYWFATIWALIFGTMVIIDAVAKRSQSHRMEATPNESELSPERLDSWP